MMIMRGFAQTMTATGLLALSLNAGMAQPAEAQAALLGPGSAYISGGTSRVATGQLNDRLAAGGYPGLGRTAYTLGVGGYRTLSSGVMLGFEGHGFAVGQEEHDGNDVGVSGGFATLAIGYAVELSPHTRVYPRIGIGAGGLALEIEDEDDAVDFDEVLANPTPVPLDRDPLLSRDGMVIDVGGGAELLSGRRSGLLLGVRFGYLLAPWNSDWDSYERDVIDAPEASIAGPYIRLTVGGAWRR
jgi:hypothetical protein